MLSEDPLRDITARAIGIYTDADVYLYTTGAFIDDGNGTFFTECPVGQRTADEVDIYFKLLLGSAPEGAWTVPVGNADSEALFWSSDQTPVGGSWQDSGETVVSLVGAGVIEVSDTAPFSAGQAIRILSTEATVDSVFTPGAPGVLTISPHIAVTGGETIEIFA